MDTEFRNENITYEDYGNYSLYNYTYYVRSTPGHQLPPKIISLLLVFFAISLNIISLLALTQIKNRITTHHRLIVSLALSDILIGVSVLMHFIYQSTVPNKQPGTGTSSERFKTWCIFLIIQALNSTGLNVSLLNLMAMAIDHYMAIIRPLHYPSRMNRSNGYKMIAFLWVLATFCGFSDFLTGFSKYNEKYPKFNYCEATYLGKYQAEYTVFGIAILTTIVMVFIYSRIYRKIKNHQKPGEANTSARSSSSRNEYKKNVRALITTLIILGTFIVCWLPICLYNISLIIQVNIDWHKLLNITHILSTIERYLMALLMLNCIADPVIYAVRMYDVQIGYRRLLSKCLPYAGIRENRSYTASNMWFERKTCVVKDVELNTKDSCINKLSDSSCSQKLVNQEILEDPSTISIGQTSGVMV